MSQAKIAASSSSSIRVQSFYLPRCTNAPSLGYTNSSLSGDIPFWCPIFPKKRSKLSQGYPVWYDPPFPPSSGKVTQFLWKGATILDLFLEAVTPPSYKLNERVSCKTPKEKLKRAKIANGHDVLFAGFQFWWFFISLAVVGLMIDVHPIVTIPTCNSRGSIFLKVNP